MAATYLRKGQGKSDRAYRAQSRGRWPLTRAVQIVYDEIRPYYNVTKKKIREWLEAMGPCEWHHVGSYATPCDYFDTKPVLKALLNDATEESRNTDMNGKPIYFGNEFLELFESMS